MGAFPVRALAAPATCLVSGPIGGCSSTKYVEQCASKDGSWSVHLRTESEQDFIDKCTAAKTDSKLERREEELNARNGMLTESDHDFMYKKHFFEDPLLAGAARGGLEREEQAKTEVNVFGGLKHGFLTDRGCSAVRLRTWGVACTPDHLRERANDVICDSSESSTTRISRWICLLYLRLLDQDDEQDGLEERFHREEHPRQN